MLTTAPPYRRGASKYELIALVLTSLRWLPVEPRADFKVVAGTFSGCSERPACLEPFMCLSEMSVHFSDILSHGFNKDTFIINIY